MPKTDELDGFFLCSEKTDGWVFHVGIVRWDGPHTPRMEWIPFRIWKKQPDNARLRNARSAALKQQRFFVTCSMCHMLTNKGHMCDQLICQSCAQREFGVVY